MTVEADSEASAGFAIENIGSNIFWAATVDPAKNDYRQLQQGKLRIVSGTSYILAGPLFIWKDQPGPYSMYIADEPGMNSIIPPNDTASTNYCPPDIFLAGASSAHFQIDSDHINNVKMLSDPGYLMGKILNTTEFDAAWPEDSYSGQEKAAYDYIIGTYGDPRNGQINGSMILGARYPGGANFSEEVFDSVREHLNIVANYMETANRWFGEGGIVTITNMQMIMAAQNALTSCNALMLMDETSSISLLLDAVFGLVIDLVSVIPDIGPAIAAVVQISLSVAKLDGSGHDGGANAVHETIATFAQALTTTQQRLANATAAQLKTMMANWGKAQRFWHAVAFNELSPAMLGVSSGASSDSNVLDQGYIVATERAWEIAFFQQLYYQRYTPRNRALSQDDNPFQQSWNPANGNYTYSYLVPMTLSEPFDTEKSVTLVCNCDPVGSDAVMQRLFHPDQLAVDPISFFLGAGGWRYVPPYYVVDFTGEPLPVIKSVG